MFVSHTVRHEGTNSAAVTDTGNGDCHLVCHLGYPGAVSVGICILSRCSRHWSIVCVTTRVLFIALNRSRTRWRFLSLFSKKKYHTALDERCYRIDSDSSRAELFASFRLFTMPISASFTPLEDSVDLVCKVQT